MKYQALLMLSLFATAAIASPEAPPRRAHHALVYDEAGQRVLMTGGSTPLDGGRSFRFFDDLWTFDGGGWTRSGNTGVIQSGQALAYDAKRGRLLSFGGFEDGKAHGRLYALSEGRWQLLGELADRPTAEGGFVHDRRRDRFVLFGGSAALDQAHGDTREYDGESWHLVAAQGEAPAPRQAFAMVYDAKRGRTVLFGGMGAAGDRYGDTWEYDGERWLRVAADGPPPRLSPGAAYDSRRGLTILFGGMGAEGMLGDTWAWNGERWTLLAQEGPAPRAMGYLAYDIARDRIVLFGGRTGWPDGDRSDAWEWDGTRWTEIAPPGG